MGVDGLRGKDWLRHGGITCVLQTQFSSLALDASCSVEWNGFSKFGKRSYEGHFCEIMLRWIHQLGRNGNYKFFSIFSSVQWSGTNLATLVQGHARNT